jgi:hypothetical protein
MIRNPRVFALSWFALTAVAAPSVLAQAPAPAPTPAPTPAPAKPAPAPEAPIPPAAEPAPAPADPAPAAPVPAEPAKPPADPVPAPATPAPPPPEPEPQPTTLAEPALHPVAPESDALSWYDAIEFRAFVDGYLGVNYLFPKPQTGANGVTRAYDTENGFALAWAGVDATYPADPVGGTLSLRLGPSANRIGRGCLTAADDPPGVCDDEVGLSNVKQAFAAWRPGGSGSPVELAFGKFDTIYGAEVAEAQDNLNYTRGVVYWFAQPLFHTGLRVAASLTDELTLRGLVVNGYNNTIDNNLGKSVGLQLALDIPRADYGGSLFSVTLGYLGGPERADYKVVRCGAGEHFDPASGLGCAPDEPSTPTDVAREGQVDRPVTNVEGLRHLVDLVATLTPNDDLKITVNGDFGVERVRSIDDEQRFVQHLFWGGMIGARYAVHDMFAIGARGEYFSDPDGVATGFAPNDIRIVTGTLTLDLMPADFLMVRLDNRIDWSSKEIFHKGVRELVGTMPTTTLGVIVSTD